MTAPTGGAEVLPLWLVDVDGVLNVVALEPDISVWPRWRRGVARTDGRTRSWPITWAPDVVERMIRWREQGRVEIAWLTTWGADANDELATLLGLPQLPVAGSPPGRIVASGGSVSAGDVPASTHAELAGADAEDRLTGRWWKFDVVRRVHAADPQRRLIWTDDDLAYEAHVMAWMPAHTRSLLIAPDPRVGLTAKDMDAVEDYLG